MRRIIASVLALTVALSAYAQEIRTNYRSGGITHISTAYENLSLEGTSAEIRVELASFPDGGSMYLLYLNLWQKTAFTAPKGVKMAVNLPGGKMVRLEQVGQESATKRRLENGLYLNRLKYAAEPADMEKMVKGIKSLDIVTGWDPDDYVQASFSQNELGDLLKRHCAAIQKAADHTVELKASLSGYTENRNSTLSTANPVVARGKKYDYNVLLTHLYYKSTNAEDLDLAFVIGSAKNERFHFTYDVPVRFTLNDGSVISLLNTRDDVNFVYVYPSMGDLLRMASVGVKSISVDADGDVFTDEFAPRTDGAQTFSEAVNQELQLLLSLSHR
ncbi:MAG: hypothetical protein IK008_00040 [Bacteroidales bacterium]|nr:hypothetical protein [Bacteroidales bacterium]